MRYFHFKLGPVQAFVVQARRTRDFWAGSFLLSWLSAVAINAVRQRGGSITHPEPDEAFMAWLEGKGQKYTKPTQGTIPNRFMAEVPDGFAPQEVEESVRTAWRALAECIWREDLLEKAGEATRAIWDRQVEAFWEISWCMTDEASRTDLLDRRGNLRSVFPSEEPGVKCMVMDAWQELSGAERPGANELRAFWGRKPGGNDVREGEYLCAIAFIKRRLARHFGNLEARMSGDWTLRGWTLPTAVPSTAYLAAAPWLAELIDAAATHEQGPAVLAELLDAADELGVDYGEYDTNLTCVAEALNRMREQRGLARDLVRLDGKVFFATELDNENQYPDRDKAKRMKQALKSAMDILKIGKAPSPFYAVLMLDGDGLGAMLSDPSKRVRVSPAVKQFTAEVRRIVEGASGFLVYAGGDDVLALLPLDYALDCAVQLRQAYIRAFDGQALDGTASVALIYCHVHTPLAKVLRDVHVVLESIAKETCGRDALAVRVWKPGGVAVDWAQPWEVILTNGNGETLIHDLCQTLVRPTGEKPLAQDDLVRFSNKFFYNLRREYEILNPDEETGRPLFSDEDELAFLATEYLHSGVRELLPKELRKKVKLEWAKQAVKPLVVLCHRRTRVAHQSIDNWARDTRFEIDGALLVRFLVQKGRER